MTRVVPHTYNDWAVIDDAGNLIGYLDHKGEPISTTPGVGDVTQVGAQTLSNKTLASPAFTGTATGLTKAAVGLANVNNTADADKIISDATQLALNAKVPATRTINGQPLSSDITIATGGASTLIVHSGSGRALANSDNGNVIRCTGAAAMTIPSGLVAGFSCVIVQGGSSAVTVAAGSGVTLAAKPALTTALAEDTLAISPTGTDTYTCYSPVTGGGATTYAALTDKASVDLPSINTALASALAARALAADLTAEIASRVSGDAGKQNTLVSGTSIKTINGVNLLGSGDIVVTGSGVLGTVSGTNAVGSVLTFTPASGLTGTIQWQRNGTNISGATSLTYTLVSADAGASITAEFTPTVFEPTGTTIRPYFTAQSAPAGTVGTAYSYTFAATGAVSYAVASGSLPAGLSLNTATGAVTGSPTAAATSTFVISATNTGGTTTSASQSVTVAAGSSSYLRFTTLEDSNLTESGSGPYTYTTTAGSYKRGKTSTLKMVSGVAAEVRGRIETVTNASDHRFILGLSTDITKQPNQYDFSSDTSFILQGGAAGGDEIYRWVSGVYDNAGFISVTQTAGQYEIKISRDTSNNFQLAYSTNAGTSWTNVGAAVAGGTSDYYVSFELGSASAMAVSFRQSGMV